MPSHPEWTCRFRNAVFGHDRRCGQIRICGTLHFIHDPISCGHGWYACHGGAQPGIPGEQEQAPAMRIDTYSTILHR